MHDNYAHIRTNTFIFICIAMDEIIFVFTGHMFQSRFLLFSFSSRYDDIHTMWKQSEALHYALIRHILVKLAYPSVKTGRINTLTRQKFSPIFYSEPSFHINTQHSMGKNFTIIYIETPNFT